MAFEFRYQRVLDVRNLEEDREKARFAEVQHRYHQEKEELQSLKQELRELLERESTTRQGRQKAGSIIQMRRYAKLLENKIEEQKQTVEEWEEKLEEQRQELIEATQERRVMETLRENDFEKYREEVQKEAQKAADEVATQQYHREEM